MASRDNQLAPTNRSARQPYVPISFPPLDDAESDFLKDSYGNEFKFLRAHGLSIYDNEKRAEGRSILKGFITAIERGRHANVDHDAPADIGNRYPNGLDQNSDLHPIDRHSFQQESCVSDHQHPHYPAISRRFYQHEPVVSEDQYPDGAELGSTLCRESGMTPHRYCHPGEFEQHFFEQGSEVPEDRCPHGSRFESPSAAAYDEGRDYAEDCESVSTSHAAGHVHTEPALSPNEGHYYDRGECDSTVDPASSESSEDPGSGCDEVFAGYSDDEDDLDEYDGEGDGDDYDYD
ncbi:hypothetical protein TI39_contig362g00003 [Zymoseptoria brevis]|uniref:Uncharacterized protein n=1 Tax=Zymoseptoria brevis TaxID=1047168 RepID=A0A0F4GT12_9PEZI|nr:hypothetical protein TI39_contig362g00003 [Zymoseptoria brevis]